MAKDANGRKLCKCGLEKGHLGDCRTGKLPTRPKLSREERKKLRRENGRHGNNN